MLVGDDEDNGLMTNAKLNGDEPVDGVGGVVLWEEEGDYLCCRYKRREN